MDAISRARKRKRCCDDDDDDGGGHRKFITCLFDLESQVENLISYEQSYEQSCFEIIINRNIARVLFKQFNK